MVLGAGAGVTGCRAGLLRTFFGRVERKMHSQMAIGIRTTHGFVTTSQTTIARSQNTQPAPRPSDPPCLLGIHLTADKYFVRHFIAIRGLSLGDRTGEVGTEFAKSGPPVRPLGRRYSRGLRRRLVTPVLT